MKWVVQADGNDHLVVSQDGSTVFYSTAGKAIAERIAADHNLLERFADSEKAIELLMAVARESADDNGDDSGFLAATCLAHPALQPPEETT